jgi:hypothetical protein
MEDLGKSFPAAEGMVEAESTAGKPHPNEFCLNCGTKLQDVWCHHCGQKDIPRRQTLSELLINFMSSFWSYEGKFFQTTKYIFLKPGFLAVEYGEGRRETYFHPARMYVFVSFVFFLLFFSLPDSDSDSGAVQGGLSKEDREELSKIGLDTIKTGPNDDKIRWNFQKSEYKSLAQYDSVQNTLPEDKRDGWFGRLMQKRAIELQKKYNGDASALGADFLASFSDNFSKVLFYLMPFFALVLKLLYVRRDYYYSEHLVLTIYYYNFFYLAGSLMMLCNLWEPTSVLSVFIGFWIYFYLLFAMKRMYRQSWGKTILKFMIFTGLFSVLILIGVSINALASLMLM